MTAYRKHKSKYTESEQAERRINRDRSTSDVLTALRADCPTAWESAFIVGRWVWIEFAGKPTADVRRLLYLQGFSWNRERRAWQHSGGFPIGHSPGDPRAKYGKVRARDLDESKVQA